MAHIQFLTCSSLEGYFESPKHKLITEDDALLFDALLAAGHKVSALVWDSEDALAPVGDLILVRSPWDYFEKAKAFGRWLDLMEEGGYPLMNAPRDLRWNMNKNYLRQLRDGGVNILPTEFITLSNYNGLLEFFNLFSTDELIIKPVVGANAFKTHRFGRDQLTHYEDMMQAYLEECDFMVQPFAPSVLEQGEWSLVFFNGQPSHAFIKRPAKGDFRVQGEHGGTLHVESPPAGLWDKASSIVAKLPSMPLYARVDGVFFEGEFALMEVEMFEPELYFRLDEKSPQRMVAAIEQVLERL